jgi:hypothetical protein
VRVDFTADAVSATSADGKVRKLKKGSAIDNGETVSTALGIAQLRFPDGAYVSLKPQTDFRVDDYAFEGKEDGEEKSFVSLLKGVSGPSPVSSAALTGKPTGSIPRSPRSASVVRAIAATWEAASLALP